MKIWMCKFKGVVAALLFCGANSASAENQSALPEFVELGDAWGIVIADPEGDRFFAKVDQHYLAVQTRLSIARNIATEAERMAEAGDIIATPAFGVRSAELKLLIARIDELQSSFADERRTLKASREEIHEFQRDYAFGYALREFSEFVATYNWLSRDVGSISEQLESFGLVEASAILDCPGMGCPRIVY